MAPHLGTNGGDEAHSCHVCTADGFDFLYVLVAVLVHDLQNMHANKHTMQRISQKFKREREKSHLIKVGDDLIQQPQALNSHVVTVQLDVEIVEVWDGGKEDADLRVGLVVEILLGDRET